MSHADPPRDPVAGIHHVTAIASDPQANVDFYVDLLGLRLVKRTVNFDDPGTYHLYYGDGGGRPGTILTFFPWPGARRGIRGSGQATVTAFSVPAGSLGYWRQRLTAAGVVHGEPARRFGEEVLAFLDPDGLLLELVAHADAGGLPPWDGSPVPAAHSVRGFHSVTLSVDDAGPTAAVLTEGLGLRHTGAAGRRQRFRAGDGTGPGARVDVVESPEAGRGRVAAGTVHHVAWRVADDAEQLARRQQLGERGLDVTPVMDRRYFRSIYFREPGGVLFEMATDPPGFTADEPLAELGSTLKLPPWLEEHRERIEATLPALEAPRLDAAQGAA